MHTATQPRLVAKTHQVVISEHPSKKAAEAALDVIVKRFTKTIVAQGVDEATITTSRDLTVSGQADLVISCTTRYAA